MSRLLSVNIGLPQDITWRGQTVRSAIWKQPVEGRRMAARLNIAGDGQGDLAGHGGENRAVMVYQMDSYHYWEAQLSRHDFSFGQFGENFTVVGLPDDEVCIGDRYRIGGALFEVTQPRVTCYRVGIRMNEPAMPSLLVSHHRPGFYFRVLEEGEVGAGDEITKVADEPERITVADIDALLYLPGHPRDQLQSAVRIPALSAGWKTSLHALAAQRSSRPVWWLYGARNRSEHPFAQESRELLQALARGQSHVVYSRPTPDDQLGRDYDSPGHLDVALVERLRIARNAEFYLCGPAPFLRSFTVGLKTRGADSARIYEEIFGPEESITPGIAPSSGSVPHVPAGPPGHGPQISFTRSGLTAPWDARFPSLLDFAEACDVPVRWSCRTGVCHTCESALIGGAVDYQPEPLEPPAQGNVLICCSQPSGDVEIDL